MTADTQRAPIRDDSDSEHPGVDGSTAAHIPAQRQSHDSTGSTGSTSGANAGRIGADTNAGQVGGVTSPAHHWWSDRGVKVKVLVAVAVPTLAAMLIGFVGIQAMGSATDRANALYNTNLRGVEAVSDMSAAIDEMQLASRDVLIASSLKDKSAQVDAFKAAGSEFAATMTSFRSLDLSSEQQALAGDLQSAVTDYRSLFTDVLLPLATDGEVAEWDRQNDAQVAPISDRIEQSLTGLRAADHASAQQKLSDIDAAST